MNRMSRALVALLLLGFIGAAAIPASAGPEDRLDSIEERKERVRRQIEVADDKGDSLAIQIRGLDEKRAQAEAEVQAVDLRLTALDAEINEVRAALTEAQQRVSFLTEKVTVYRERLDAQMQVLQARAVATYKAGPSATIDGLLSSEDFGDLMDRYTYYQSALETDAALAADIQSLEAVTSERKRLVEEHKNDIAQQKLKLEQDRAEVSALRSKRAAILAARQAAIRDKENILGGIRSRQDRLERIQEQLDQDSQEIQSLLSTGGSVGSPPVGGGQLSWPANGPVTSPYGYRTHPIFGDSRLHTGIDIGAPYGAPVWAAGSGQVAYVGVMSGYGNVVVIEHGGGLATTYNHLSAFNVSSGQSVSRGTHIASVGCTGYCTGPHLHFEVRVNGSPVDPMPYLR